MKKIIHWLRQPFHLLDSIRSRWQLVIFCGVFGCIFLNVFKPFNMSTWFPQAETPLFIIITFFSAAGMAALALSQFAFRELFKIELTTRISFLVWTLFEFFIISLAAHVINFIFTHHPLFDFNEYLETIKYTFLVLVLPYFLMILFLYLQQQLMVVEELSLKAALPMASETIALRDENDKVVLSLAAKNILYFKSEDNYVLLFYKIENKINKELIRTNLKKLEKDLNHPNFIRIHRSYMINSQNLASAIKNTKGYQLKLASPTEIELPVSVSYQKEFEAKVIQKT